MTRPAPDIPVLETERLVLRAPREADLPAILAFSLSPRAEFVGRVEAPWQAWNILCAGLGHWALRGHGWWLVEDRATGAAAGRVGIGHHIDWPEPELGWHIYDGFEGRGYAFEAALAARDWWRRHRPAAQPPISLIAPANTRSQALARRLGARIEGRTEIRGSACDIWRHPQEAA